MKLRLIPAGEFKMGSGESTNDTAAFFNKTYYRGDLLKPDDFKIEHPQHRVRITKPFYLGVYHVTRGQFRQFVTDAGYKTDAEIGPDLGAYGERGTNFNETYSWRTVGFEQTDKHPVVNVSWNDALAFCKWLSRKEGKTYRLPTEAEWEYACRAGTTTRYYSGDDPETLAKAGNVADAAAKVKFPNWGATIGASDGYVFTAPVGSFKPNAFGLYDMHGNASQWCSDWFSEEYYDQSPVDDPTGPHSGHSRVLRGGSWDRWPYATRSAARAGLHPDFRGNWTGFRVVRTEQQAAAEASSVPIVDESSRAAQRAREAARRAQVSSVKEIGMAIISYHDARNDKLPPAYTTDKVGKPLLSWRVRILPYLGEQDLYRQFHVDEPWDSEHNKKLIPQMPAVYRDPQGPGTPGVTNYLTVRGKDTVFPGEDVISTRQIKDGASNTIMIVGVNNQMAVVWTKPDDFEFDEKNPLAGLVESRRGGFVAGFADGSVRFIPETIKPETLKALFTRSGGEAIPPGEY